MFAWKATYRTLTGLILLIVLAGCGALSEDGSTLAPPITIDTPTNLIWSDEFNGSQGTGPQEQFWILNNGKGGGVEYFLPQNAQHDGNGALNIQAKKENLDQYACDTGLCQYTSARIQSKGKFDFQYGRIEARIKLPGGQALWPQFFLLGNDYDLVKRPACGEITIMEHIGREPAQLYGSLQGPNYSGEQGLGGSYLHHNGSLADAYHVYGAEWTPNGVRFTFDGNTYLTVTRADVEKKGAWVFDHPFFLVFSLNVGGEWSGQPDMTSPSVAGLYLDYVRAYKL